MNLKQNETLLLGRFIFKDGRVVSDDTASRIDYLKSNVLVKVATSDDGWTSLFKDPNDNRLWELTYNSADSHGGGAPTLKLVSLDEARIKYTKFTG